MNDIVKIIPLIGIKIGSKNIKFYDNQQKIKIILGKPESIYKNSYYYFQGELRIDFDESGLVVFIEFLGGMNGKIQPEIYGVKVFEVEADNLYMVLKSKNKGYIDNSENGYSYSFLNISIGVYRDTIPEDVYEMIKEAKDNGEPIDNNKIEYEMRKAIHWHTIGIGVKNYYL